ncbi:MAG TPA: hypothetical protein VMB34_30635 [Acetobacteraceae bacterium]|nr:hypothetical protein [Acetobacteraceae bacterium]
MSLETELEHHLSRGLGDAVTARAFATILLEETLSWSPPLIAPEQIATILAFTFGNRMLPNGNREPGPVNAALADIVADLHQRTGARIFAQWEVAAVLEGRVPSMLVTVINPARDARDEPVYRSTTGVLVEIARLTAPQSLGRVGVVAFADHAYRCVATARRLGFDAYAPAGMPLPNRYDPESGQAWCRERTAYLLHDVMIRITERRAAVVGAMRR